MQVTLIGRQHSCKSQKTPLGFEPLIGSLEAAKTARQYSRQDSAAICSSTDVFLDIKLEVTGIFRASEAGLLVAISDKFVVPSVPLTRRNRMET